MKIDGSNETMQCEAPAAQVASPPRTQPMASINRVEQARVEERAYAGPRDSDQEKLYRVLDSVPTPGALELELSGKIDHNGGKAKVTAERDRSGEFLVRIEAQGQGALAVPVAALEVGAHASLTYRVRTPEAAADLLHSLALTGAAPSASFESGDAARVAHYGAQSLERVGLTLEGGPSLHGQLTIAYGGLEVSQKATGYVDFNKHLLVTEQAVGGEALGRASVLVVRAGFEGEVALKLRTELELPDEVLSRVASGELSVADVLRGTEATRKLVLEGEERSDVTTVFAGGYAQVKKLDAELDLDQLVSNPTEPQLALKGGITTMMSDQKALGFGFDVPGLNFLGRAAIYTVSEQHLFQSHDGGGLQQELDAKRSAHH
jgi:hypothetical protein